MERSLGVDFPLKTPLPLLHPNVFPTGLSCSLVNYLKSDLSTLPHFVPCECHPPTCGLLPPQFIPASYFPLLVSLALNLMT